MVGAFLKFGTYILKTPFTGIGATCVKRYQHNSFCAGAGNTWAPLKGMEQ